MSPAKLFAAAALLATAGCVRWVHVTPSELQIHGKVGQVCSAAATPFVWSANTALFPVSVATLGRKTPSHDNLGYPGLAVENAAYFACATVGLPLHALGWGAERVFALLAGREALEDHLVGRLPHLSAGDYARLVRTSRRACPPRYDGESPRVAPEAASPGEFGLWSTAHVPRYGSKPRLGNPLAAAEWRDWRAAGRPRDADDEFAFVANRALEFSEPATQFASTYGAAQLSRFEKRLADEQVRMAALRQSGTEAAVAAALADPSPMMRAAAARLRARTGDGGAAGVLARLLEDRAVMVRAAAADGLAALADPGSVAALGRAVNDADEMVRERAALALGTIGTGAAAEALLRSLGSLGHPARFDALRALAAAGKPGVADALALALADPDLHTRIAAAAAIGRTAATPDDPLLGRALGDADPWVSGTAARVRERRDDPDAPR